MKLFLTNSLTKKLEEFVPIDENKVRMYACGPTVYDRPHLGNARAAVTYDLLFRTLKLLYKNVEFAHNITDVDDKIIAACQATGEEFTSLTTRMTKCYFEDVASLNCLPPTHTPHATKYIAQMVDMIQTLIQKGHAYETEGHVCFSVASFQEYGKLSNRSRDDMIAGARVEIAPYKKDPADFVLWKPSNPDDADFGFASPFSHGRPGWHIECSAMTRSIFGEQFDIHGGGADLMFPHHENEIAQSECSSEHGTFANYWVHNGFLMVEGEKMSKSLGNFKTVREALDEGINGNAIRYFFLSTHYRKPIDFTQKNIDDAKKALNKFHRAMEGMANDTVALPEAFKKALCNDLNTPEYIAHIHGYVDAANKGDNTAKLIIKAALDAIGLEPFGEAAIVVPKEVTELAELRLKARADKNWAESDRLRDAIATMGYAVKDEAGGYKITKA